MKIFKHLFLLTVLSVALFSCKKDSTNIGGGGTSSMTAKVDNQSWTASLTVKAIKNSTALALTGTATGSQITIVIPTYTGAGTYQLGQSQENYASYTSGTDNYSANAAVGAGSVNVTSDAGGIIQGTFQFNGINEGSLVQKSITTGAFKISY